MGEPTRYMTPDCVVDFTSIDLEQAGKDRVAVSGIRGSAATDSYKVSISYLAGYKATGQLTVSGPDAAAKAQVCADALWGRLGAARAVEFEDTSTELLGVDSCHGRITPTPGPWSTRSCCASACVTRTAARSIASAASWRPWSPRDHPV